MLQKFVVCYCFLAPLLVISRGFPSENTVRVFENNILETIEDLRLRMCYYDPEGLPQLDPLVIPDDLNLDIDLAPTKIKGFVRNLRIEGLSNFFVDHLQFLITLKFDLGFYFSKVVITGDYGLDANIGSFFKISGSGPFRFQLDKIRLGANAAFVYDKMMFLRNLKLKPQLESLLAYINGLTGNELLNDFIAEILSNAVPEVVSNRLPPDVLEYVQNLLENEASAYLNDLTTSDLLNLITGKESSLPPVDMEKACKEFADE